jgi:osmoprotectant transport system ATP-binding protein
LIELRNCSKYFGEKAAVKDLDLSMENGKITMLIGPSGCGKTTTLKMINRLVEASAGDILIDGQSIYGLDAVTLRRSIGYVIQEIGLFPHMNVYDNIAAVPRLLKWDEQRIRERVRELLDLVTLDESYIRSYPLQLSGGERQRVGLARGLAADPEILLMDEPFGAIDPINRAKLHDSFAAIQEKIRKTIVFVTHDINEAIKLGDNIAIMREGRLEQYGGVTDILYRPQSSFVEQLLGRDRNIKALILKRNRDYISRSGFVQVGVEEGEDDIIAEIRRQNDRWAVAVDADGALAGLYYLENGVNGTAPRLRFREDPIQVNENSNLQETFSLMIDAGEASLPVVGGHKHFLGLIKLEDIFNEFRIDSREEEVKE